EKCARARRICARRTALGEAPGPTVPASAGSLTAFASIDFSRRARGAWCLCFRGAARRAFPARLAARQTETMHTLRTAHPLAGGAFQEGCRPPAYRGSATMTSRFGAAPIQLKG